MSELLLNVIRVVISSGSMTRLAYSMYSMGSIYEGDILAVAGYHLAVKVWR